MGMYICHRRIRTSNPSSPASTAHLHLHADAGRDKLDLTPYVPTRRAGSNNKVSPRPSEFMVGLMCTSSTLRALTCGGAPFSAPDIYRRLPGARHDADHPHSQGRKGWKAD
jgi:hypothetical protein